MRFQAATYPIHNCFAILILLLMFGATVGSPKSHPGKSKVLTEQRSPQFHANITPGETLIPFNRIPLQALAFIGYVQSAHDFDSHDFLNETLLNQEAPRELQYHWFFASGLHIP